MRLVKLGAAVLNQTPLDWAGNARRIRAAMALARARQVGLLCLPEMCITGYGAEDAFLSPGVQRRSWALLRQLSAETAGMAVSFGLPVLHRGKVYDCAALAVDGQLVGLSAKRDLAGDGVHYEPRWFRPWPRTLRTVHRALDGSVVPIGDYVFDVGGVRVGFEICEEAWVARRPGATLAHRGVDVLLNPSASHFAFGKWRVRERFVLEGSRAFAAAYVYANLVGDEAGRIVYDGDATIAADGRIVAAGPRFSFQEVGLTTGVVDVDALRLSRARTVSFHTDPADDADATLVSPLAWPVAEPQAPHLDRAAWESGPHEKFEELARAVALGLFDYLRKSGSQGWVVSLSGGADSAAVATLCGFAIRLAVAELGLDATRQRLAHVRGIDECEDVHALTRRLLATVYQATENSGEATRAAAAAVAAGLGAAHREWDVAPIVAAYRALLGQDQGRDLTWAQDDVALQNIQARARAPSVWMLANIEGKLLLSTSNRSEAAVGYATMDGDTSGGVAPISGVDKATLRSWLDWVRDVGPEGVGPIAGVRAVTHLAPTAELRPPDQHQTDEDDLMPYPVLDAIERAAIRDKLEPAECLRVLAVSFPDSTVDQRKAWVTRFFRLWSRNQWKRERYAPGFHLDDENLDPKTWCRFPILSGGFRAELEELGEPEG
jgi:NAD+ synthase (glutamine-hydrolysing)